MSASGFRRLKRHREREAKKLFEKITKQTMDQINKQPEEERQKLLDLYKLMMEEKEAVKTEKQNGM
jgi:hypothetical protein